MPDITLPTPGVTPGPVWASTLNNAISAINETASAAVPNTAAGREALTASDELSAAFVSLKQAAKNPDLLIVGNITRNSDQAVTSADVVWPDGTPGTFTTDTLSTAFPGAVDAYHITYGSPVTKTFTQPAITRNSAGAATTVPQIVVS